MVESQTSKETVLEKAFVDLSEEIKNTLLVDTKKAVTLTFLYKWFTEKIAELNSDQDALATAHSSWKLKDKLQKHFGDELQFISQSGKSDMVCSSRVTIGNGARKAEALSAQMTEMVEGDIGSFDPGVDQVDDAAILHGAAVLAISRITFQSTHYVPSDDINIKQCRSFVPDILYDFIAWCTMKELFDNAECSVNSEARDSSIV